MNDGPTVKISDFTARIDATALSGFAAETPWALSSRLETIVAELVGRLGARWRVLDAVAIHETATVEPYATLKGPAVIGPGVFVANGAYLRGGVFLDEDTTIGPACEIKSSAFMRGSKAAHLSFVGDSIVGAEANIEAGAMIANFRNEKVDKRIRIVWRGAVIDTGVTKFGALIGDGVRIGANAVIAPGALLEKAHLVPRLALVDQAPAD